MLKMGTQMYRVRGMQFYKRKYWLDMENLVINFSPNKNLSGCGKYALSDVTEVRWGYQTHTFYKLDDKFKNNNKN